MMGKEEIYNCELYNCIRMIILDRFFAKAWDKERDISDTDKPKYRWMESKIKAPYNTFMDVFNTGIMGSKYITSRYDAYNEILYVGSWVLQDEY